MSAGVIVRNRSARAATTALFLGNGFLIGAWAANIPRFRDLHGLSDTGLGTLLLAFGIGAVAAMAVTSPLAARVGAGRLASVAAILNALLLPMIAVVSDWPLLLAISVTLGVLNGTTDVAMNAYASHLERRWGGAIMSSFHAGWSIGGLGAAMLVGVLASLGWTVADTFLLASCVTALSGCVGFALPDDDRGTTRGAAFRLPSRRLAGICLLALLSFQTEGAIVDWSGVYLRTVAGAGEAWATTGYTAFALTMVAGRLAGNVIVRRLGPVRVVQLGGVLALIGLGVALAVPNRWVVDAGLVVVGAGLANVIPVMFSAAGRLAGTAGVAMASASGFSGLLVAPPLLGNVADAIGLRLALLLVLAAAVAMMLLAGAVAGRPDGPA